MSVSQIQVGKLPLGSLPKKRRIYFFRNEGFTLVLILEVPDISQIGRIQS